MTPNYLMAESIKFISTLLEADVQLWQSVASLTSLNFQLMLRIVGGLNMLRGFFIFLVFIFKPSVWKMIKTRHPRLARALARPYAYVRNKWLGAPPPEVEVGLTELHERRNTIVTKANEESRPLVVTQV